MSVQAPAELTPSNPTPADELRLVERRLAARSARLLGYPESMRFDIEPLLPLMRYNIDNLGDPYSELLYGVNSTEIERQVLAWFSDLYHLDRDDSWGYVTSSGSEGNLYGLYLGREAHPEAVLYYSAATHYSIPKAARLLRLDSHVVPAQSNGEIDYAAFEVAVRSERRRRRPRPAIVNATLGTTMAGAVDDVARLADILRRNGIDDFYLHCDAALSGMVLPFAQGAAPISFEQPIDSVCVSGHKFLGAPYPCAVVLTRQRHVRRIQTEIPYIGALDATIGGSRNGQAPLYLWHAIRTRGADGGFEREVATCLSNARHLYRRLTGLGVHPLLNEHSITVVFDEPGEWLVRRWSLARAHGRAHVVVVPHATRDVLDAFLAELEADLATARP